MPEFFIDEDGQANFVWPHPENTRFKSDYYHIDSEGFLTIRWRLSRDARFVAGGNYDFRSVIDVVFDRFGGDAANEVREAAEEMVDTVKALSRADAEAFFATADIDTLMHLRSLGLPSGVGEMAVRGLFDIRRRRKNGRS